jgi:hypothetical protein
VACRSRGIHRGPKANSIGSSRNCSVRSRSRSMTEDPMRPSRCQSRPWEPARSTNPVSHGSTITRRRVSAQRVPRDLGARPTLHRRGEHPHDGHAAAVSLAVTACASHRPSARPVLLAARASMSCRRTRPLVSFSPDVFPTFRLRKTKGFQLQRHALSERNHNCPHRIEQAPFGDSE